MNTNIWKELNLLYVTTQLDLFYRLHRKHSTDEENNMYLTHLLVIDFLSAKIF